MQSQWYAFAGNTFEESLLQFRVSKIFLTIFNSDVFLFLRVI